MRRFIQIFSKECKNTIRTSSIILDKSKNAHSYFILSFLTVGDFNTHTHTKEVSVKRYAGCISLHIFY